MHLRMKAIEPFFEGKSSFSFRNSVGIFFLGFVGFSSFWYGLGEQVFRIPVYFPEPFFFLALLLSVYSKTLLGGNVTIGRATVLSLLGLIALWMLLVFIAIFESSVFYTLSSARPWLYAILAGFLAREVKQCDPRYLFFLCVGAVSGDLLSSAYIFSELPTINGARGIFSINILATFLMVALSVALGRRFYIAIAIVLGGLAIPLSGFRVVAFSVFLGFFLTMTVLFGKDRKLFFLTISSIIPPAVFSVFLIYLLERYAIDVHDFARFRISERLISLLKGDFHASQDGERIEKILHYLRWDNMDFFPSGFVMRSRGVGDFNDVPWLNFTVTFGAPIGVLVLLIIFFFGIIFAVNFFRTKKGFSSFNAVSVASIPFFAFLLIVNGRFAYVLYESVMIGVVIGSWFWGVRKRSWKAKQRREYF